MGLLTSNSRYRGDLKEVGFRPFFHLYPHPVFSGLLSLCMCVCEGETERESVCEDDGCEDLLTNVR